MSPALSRLTAATFAIVFGLVAPAIAEQRPVVVELFTSQGCSSCPPADAMFEALDERDDVIAIALHVDYWDYIGWKDPFGDPAHAVRQRAYAEAGGRRSIYTPEILVNGQTDIVGAKPMKLSKAIAEHKAAAPKIALDVVRDGDRVRLSAQPLVTDLGKMTVHVLRLKPSETTSITRGENRGRTIEYTNIAHAWTVVGQWDGTDTLSMTADAPGTDPVVVLIQAEPMGAIVAAARID